MNRKPERASGTTRLGALLTATALASTLAAAVLAGAGPAAASPVKVGAGEHTDHSRVVFNMPAPSTWSARPVEGGLEIRLPGADYDFDASSVTSRRMAHRVDGFASRVENGETIVTLGFNCACVGRATSNGGKLLMVEVRDGAPASAPLDRRAEAEATGAITTNDIAEEGAPGAPASPSAATLPDGPLVHPANEVDRVRELLLQQLRRAADQGIIQFKGDAEAETAKTAPDGSTPMEKAIEAQAETKNPHKPDDASMSDGEDPAGDKPMSHGETDRARTDHGQEDPSQEGHAETPKAKAPKAHADAGHGAADKAHAAESHADDGHKKETHAATQPKAAAHGAQADDGHAAEMEHAETVAQDGAVEPVLAACLPDEALEAGDWLDDRPYPEALAAYRAAIYDDLNRADPDAVAELAGFYLGNLFAPEAAHTIEVFRVSSPRLTLLSHIASVVKGEPPALASPFARSEPCPGRHGLWQAAALWEIDPALSVAAFEASGRELARTPQQFRRLIGGRVARAALKIGKPEIANEILQLLMRNAEAPSADMLMARAELARQEGRIVAAQEDLQTVIDARDGQSPIAAIRLSETFEPPHDAARAQKLRDVLADFALQYRDSPTGDAVVMAEAEFRARFNDLRGALDLLHRAQSRLGEPNAEFDALGWRLIEQQIERLERDPRADTAVDAFDALSSLGDDAQTDALRRRLARVLIDTDTPHLATLLLDEEAALRSSESAALREEALEASRLALQEMNGKNDGQVGPDVDSMGLPDPMADQSHPAGEDDHGGAGVDMSGLGSEHGAPHGDEAGRDEPDALTLKDEALKRYLAGDQDLPPELDAALEGAADQDVRELRRLFAPSLEPRALETGVEKISRGKQLLDEIDSDIDLLKGIANDG